MTPHLSPLELDEIAAGLLPHPAHLDACPDCRARLEALTAANATLLATPEAKAQLTTLLTLVRSPPTRWRRVALWAAPLAAGLALVLAWPRDDVRLKGGPQVVLLDAADRSVTQGAVGQRLTVAVGSGGYAYGAIVAVDDEGKVETLWPRHGERFAPLPPGPRSRLLELEVTPGNVTVEARFANDALLVNAPGDEVRRVRLLVR